MSRVVPFRPKPEPEVGVWVCNCGCTTHYHRTDGLVECGSCSAIAGEATGGWRERLPQTPDEAPPMPDEAFKVASLADFPAFMRRQIITHGGNEGAAAVVLFTDGRVETWGDKMGSDERAAWLRDELQSAYERMTGYKWGDGQ